MNNVTTTKAPAQLVWMLDFSAPVVETEMHDGAQLPKRDRDGKYAPQEKPLTRKQAMKKLSKQSKRLDAAIDRLQEMENW